MARSRGRLAHAYLFYGPEHVGKLTIALAHAQFFFCAEATEHDIRSVCGQCASCRAIAEYRHPAVAMLDTTHTLVSKKETRKEIPIEDMRELKRIFSFAPQGDTMRLAIINEAEKMSEEAANAFLKLLEEPGANTLIILITPSRELLLSTIVSRTFPISFSTLSDQSMMAMADILKIAAHDRTELLVLAAGRPGVLVELASDAAAAADDRLLFHDVAESVEKRDFVSLMQISERASKDLTLRAKTISYLFLMLRAKMLGDAARAERIAAHITRIDQIAHLMDSTNVNPRLGMDALFLECIKS